MIRNSKILNIISLIIIITSLYSCKHQKTSSNQHKPLNDWEFYYSINKTWYPAKTPGNIHTDLYDNNLIPDPFYSDNEQKLQWIDNEIWHYRTTFSLQNIDKGKHELVFHGLDTYAKIVLNGDTLVTCNNMYRKWVLQLNGILKQGENSIEIIFNPASIKNSIDSSKFQIPLPDNRAFSRKAPYHFGWDWGPKFETCGIWKKVELISWNDFRITNTYVTTDSIISDKAFLNCKINIEAETKCDADISINDNNNSFSKITYQAHLQTGINEINIPIEIDNPKLWWCNGTGESNLYKFNIKVSNRKFIDTTEIDVGIRTISLVKDTDSIGESFYFLLNNKPIYALGANWVPAESFPGNLTTNKYRKLLIDAKEANFNMLRVWGGGIYENDEFYSLCDSLGIMVWQDFMFACNMYPANETFLENVKKEVSENIIRLRQHPSIALWCGNNEIMNGWNDWGWQEQLKYSKSDSIFLMYSYNEIFKNIIPKQLSDLDSGRSYHESSPTFGWGHDESITHGDSHYWGVWWGMEDFNIFYEKTGRFMSEYGFQGCPPLCSLYEFLDSSEINLSNKGLKNHQKHPFGFEAIGSYMKRHFPKPKDFEEYVYYSQLLQAKAMQTALDAHLLHKPDCMGTLFWQFNDCWPAISWSVIDYYGYKKAAYYTVKNMFQSHILAVQAFTNKMDIYLVSHKGEPDSIICNAKILDFEGNILFSKQVQVKSNPNNAQIVYSLNYSEISKPLNKVFMHLSTNTGFERMVLFVPEKDLILPKSDIKWWHTSTKDSIRLYVTSSTFMPNVYAQAFGKNNWDKNFFYIMPRDTVELVIEKTEDKIEENSLKLFFLRL